MTRSRAFVTIVTGPGHLIGDAKQVADFYAGKKGAALPPWYDEWNQYLGNTWDIRILESPSDVGQFFRDAVHTPTKPLVGMIANSKLKLDSGATLGAEIRELERGTSTRTSTIATRLDMLRAKRDRFYANVDAEIEANEAAYKRQRQKAKQVEATVGADAERSTTDEPIQWEHSYVNADGETKILRLPLWKRERDRLLRQTFVLPRHGVCCPRCGRRALNLKGAGISPAMLRRKGLRTISCVYCNERLGQASRIQDNVHDRTHPIWQTPEWQEFYYDENGHRALPGERPTSNARYALGLLIGKRYAGMVDVYLADEIHECKGLTTALGRAFGAMKKASRYTIGLTGTLYGGYASTLYALLLRMDNKIVMDRWGWNNQPQFVREAGITAVIDREIERRDEAGHYSGKSRCETVVRERPGITAQLATVVQNTSVMALIDQMGFNMPGYTEDMVLLSMPPHVRVQYDDLEDVGRRMIAAGGYDALASYLRGTLRYPYQPWRDVTIASKIVNEVYQTDTLPSDIILPHHEYLAEFCSERINTGRRVLVFVEHTGEKHDICIDLQHKVAELAGLNHETPLKIAILRSTTVKPGERAQWFKEREEDGTQVVICNPRLVKTGLNLIAWSSIVVLEPVYSLYDLFQAKRRAYRPTNRQDCEVIFVGYSDTMSERALGVVARKAASAAILNGADLTKGLLEFDAGMSLLEELAKAIRNGEDSIMNADVRAMLQESAKSIKASMERGTADLLGVTGEILLPSPRCLDHHPHEATSVGPDDVIISSGPFAIIVEAPSAPEAVELYKTVIIRLDGKPRGSTKTITIEREQWAMDV